MDKHVLTLDCGTQSVRALLFDKNGNLNAKVKKTFKAYNSPRPGWAEQDPDFYFEKMCEACRELRDKNPGLFRSIIAVSVTTQRDTFVNVDKEGKPLRPAIHWLDQRKAKGEVYIPPILKAGVTVINMSETVEIMAKEAKVNWIKENQPELWRNTYKFMLLSSYLNYKLTGKFEDSIASQVGHIPFDYKGKKWAGKYDIKKYIFPVEKDKLVDIVEPGERLGQVTKEASKLTTLKEGLPVIASGSDKGCETLGNGCMDLKTGSISLGSAASIQTTSKDYFETLRFIPPYPSVVKGYYNPEVQIFKGYWMVTWFKNEFAHKEVVEAQKRGISPEEVLNEKLRKIPPGSHGLMLQPYWGPGLKMPEAKGSILGFADVHTRIHIYRAIIEGIAYGLLEGVESIERKSGVKMEKMVISGGGSQSDEICQISADIANRPIFRTQTYETSGLGAAIVTFTAMKEYRSIEEAVKHMVRYESKFYPNLENAKIYQKLYKEIYKELYSKLKPIYKKMRKIIKY